MNEKIATCGGVSRAHSIAIRIARLELKPPNEFNKYLLAFAVETGEHDP